MGRHLPSGLWSEKYPHRRHGFDDDRLRAEVELHEAEDRASILLDDLTRTAGQMPPRDLANWIAARAPGLPNGTRSGLQMGGIGALFGWMLGHG